MRTAYPPTSELKTDGTLDKNYPHQALRDLNNVLDQGHRAINWSVQAGQHFRSF